MIAPIVKCCFRDGELDRIIRLSIVLNIMLSKICYMSMDSARISSVKSTSMVWPLCGKSSLLQAYEIATGSSRRRTLNVRHCRRDQLVAFREAEINDHILFYLSCNNKEIFWKALRINVLTSAITLIIIILGLGFTGFETRRPNHFL
jgi:hypothetical protein